VSCEQALDLTQIKSRGEADKALSTSIPADGLRAFVLTNLKLDKPNKRFAWRCNLDVLRSSVADIMDFPLPSSTVPYSGPTLFLGGANSSYISADHMESIHRLFPNASVEHVDNAGHFVHVDQPGLVGQCIASFIAIQ
jgi:esterase